MYTGYFGSHMHSEKSNFRSLDSINRPKALFNRVLEAGLTGFAITDHETLSAHVEIMQYRDKIEKNMKLPAEERDPSLPILPEDFTVAFGNEAYLVNSSTPGQERYWHWLVIAKDRKGHDILRKMSSTAWGNSFSERGTQRVPISKAEVEEIMKAENGKGHITATSACIGGELGHCALTIKKLTEAGVPETDEKILSLKQQMVDYVLWNQEVFGEDNFYIELAPNDKEDQRFCNNMFWNLAKQMNAPAIFATDAHYLKKEDRDVHRAFLNSQDAEREVDEFYSTAYVMTLEEVWNFMKIDFTREDFELMVGNLEKIRKGIESYTLFHEQIVPKVDVNIPEPNHPELDKKYENMNILINSKDEQDLYWIQTCLNELYKRGKWNEPEYLETLEKEAEVIVKVSDRMEQSIAAYYNTAQRLIEVMWNEGNSLVGVSRGSAMAFLSNWLLDITQIDPIPYGIPYWRHLSASRPELPDVDIDAEGFKREQIIGAMKEIFGEERVLNIATYGTEGSRSSIMTAARGLGIDQDVAGYLTTLIPNERGFDWPIHDVAFGNKEKKRSAVQDFVDEIGKYDKWLDTAMAIEGLTTRRGSHAAGVYIFNDDYTTQNAMMKTAKGLSITQWDMGESDMLGGVKFDFLSIEALDKIRAAMDLLIQDGEIEDKGSLKETYDHYLHPENLDYSEEMWEDAWEGKVLDLFQFQTPVGGEAIRKGKPTSVIEGAALNSLMRLMPMEDGTVPTDKFVKFKEDIGLWYEELEKAGIPEDEVKVLERHYLQSYGVPNTQEELMLLLMDEDVCGFTETEANMARKVVGKKLMDQVPVLKKMMFDRSSCSIQTTQYIWDTAIGVQMGYSFSLPHTVAYTVIALQELNIYNRFPSIYWNTACLIANSGDEGDTVNYAKIAEAIGSIKSHGISVGLVDINKSEMNFRPDVETETILYGLKAVSGLSNDVAEKLIELRPFESLEDFVERVEPNKGSVVSLIKSGAFDELEEKKRKAIMVSYIGSVIAPRKQITIASVKTLAERGLIPETLEKEHRVYEFNRYLKELFKDKNVYVLNERSQEFYHEMGFPELELEVHDSGNLCIDVKTWNKIYNSAMDPMREYFRENKESLIKALHLEEVAEEMEKQASGSLSKWEMDSVSFYHSPHELAFVDTELYGIESFSEMPREGVIKSTFMAWGREIPIYQTLPILGTVLGKNRVKGSISLLTPEGEVVLVKMSREKFSTWDRQISEQLGDGRKRVLERSWFKRGNLLMINGYRRGDQFIPKSYKDDSLKEMYLVQGVEKDGSLLLKSERG